MKFLADPTLIKISTTMEGLDIGNRVLHGRVESYSCKTSKTEKQASKAIESKLASVKSSSKKESSVGDMGDADNRKLVVTLISTLNAAFPDLEFGDTRPDQFSKEVDRENVATNISCDLLNDADSAIPSFKDDFWKAIDASVNLAESSIYSYTPDGESEDDLFAYGSGWCYFFYNKKEKRILLLLCYWVSKVTQQILDEEEELELESGFEDEEVELQEEDLPSSSLIMPSPATLAAAAVANLSVALSPLRLPLTVASAAAAKHGLEPLDLSLSHDFASGKRDISSSSSSSTSSNMIASPASESSSSVSLLHVTTR